MAELPPAQVPQIGMGQIPYMGNAGTGAAAGMQQAVGAFQQEQGIQLQKQFQQAQMVNMRRQIDIQTLESAEKAMNEAPPKLYPTMWKNVVPVLNKVTGMQLDPNIVPPALPDVLQNIAAIRDMANKGGLAPQHMQSAIMEQLYSLPVSQQAIAQNWMKQTGPGDVIGLDKNDPSKAVTYNKEMGTTGTLNTGTPMVPMSMPATQFSEASVTQRSSAEAMKPYNDRALGITLAKNSLSVGNELNDHVALNEFAKIVGAKDINELGAMAKAGTWGPKVGQIFSKFTGEGALDPQQRAVIQQVLEQHEKANQIEMKRVAGNYPGSSINVPPITKVPKAGPYKGKTLYSNDGGDTWYSK